MVSERDVRDSFAKAKSDIENLKKQLAEKAAKLEKRQEADKKEFYEFIETLDEKLEELNSGTATKEDLSNERNWLKKENEKHLKDTEKALNAAREETAKSDKKNSQINEEITEAIEKKLEENNSKTKLEIAEAKKKIATIELNSMQSPDYSSLIKRLAESEDKLDETRKNLKKADIEELKLEISELTKEFSMLGKRFAQSSDLAKSNKKLEQQEEKIEKKADETRQAAKELKKELVEKEDFERKINSVNSELKKIADKVSYILRSEVDLSEFSSRKDLEAANLKARKQNEEYKKDTDKKIEKTENELKEKLKEANSDIKDLSNNLQISTARAERILSEMEMKIRKWERSQKETDEKDELEREDKEQSQKVENYSEPSNIGNYITALILLLILAALGYYVYTQLQEPPSDVNATTQQSIMAGSLAENRTNQSPQVNLEKINQSEKTQECKARFECTLDVRAQYNYDCFYDINSTECKCFKDPKSVCTEEEKAEFASLRAKIQTNQSQVPNGSQSSSLNGYKIYLAAFIAVAIFAVILAFLLKKGEEAAINEESESTKQEKKKKKK